MSAQMIAAIAAAGAILVGGLLVFVWRQLAPLEKKVVHVPKHLYAPHDEQFLRTMSGIFTATSHDGSRVEPLKNGDEIFPAMLQAISSARRTITFETYIYWTGRIGREFAHALAERARAGVAVHVLLDWLGSKPIGGELVELMTDAGVEVERYHPPHLMRPQHTNHRTHRKLLVIDGRIGFTGGVGIADEWSGDAEDADHWRDTHFRVEGPAVIGLQRAFMDNWIKSRSAVLHSEDYFPALEPAGDATCQIFLSSPAGGSDSVRLMYLMAIAAAESSIRIATAYFVPDSLAIAALHAARSRGVSIQVLVAGDHNDSVNAKLIGRSLYGELLAEGIELYEYQPTMYHTKLMIVDDVWISVGSANFDNRSFRLNDEINLSVYDGELAVQLVGQFEEDLRRSRRIELDQWKRRPLTQKFVQNAARPLRSQV